jgi:hypothetical protein
VKELFEISQSPSPRLVWMEKHGLRTYRSHVQKGYQPWSCWSGDLGEALEKETVGHGQSEEDAQADWAKKNGVRLWNEE